MERVPGTVETVKVSEAADRASEVAERASEVAERVINSRALGLTFSDFLLYFILF